VAVFSTRTQQFNEVQGKDALFHGMQLKYLIETPANAETTFFQQLM